MITTVEATALPPLTLIRDEDAPPIAPVEEGLTALEVAETNIDDREREGTALFTEETVEAPFGDDCTVDTEIAGPAEDDAVKAEFEGNVREAASEEDGTADEITEAPLDITAEELPDVIPELAEAIADELTDTIAEELADPTVDELADATAVEDATTEDKLDTTAEEVADATGVDEAAIFVQPAGILSWRLTIDGLFLQMRGVTKSRLPCCSVCGASGIRFTDGWKTFSTFGLYTTLTSGNFPVCKYTPIALFNSGDGLALVQCYPVIS